MRRNRFFCALTHGFARDLIFCILYKNNTLNLFAIFHMTYLFQYPLKTSLCSAGGIQRAKRETPTP